MMSLHKLRLIPALLVLLILFAGCAAQDDAAAQDTDVQEDGTYDLPADDPLSIQEFVIGDSVGEAKRVVENGEERYVIFITLPLDTDFKNCVANIMLPSGAWVSGDSPAVVNDLAGRPVLNLTQENSSLIIANDGETREYGFEISLPEE